MRQTINKIIKKKGKLKINIFPHLQVTKKPLEVRMGKGKGAPDQWVAVVKPGKIMFEVEGVSRELAAEAFRIAGYKLPIKTKLAERREQAG